MKAKAKAKASPQKLLDDLAGIDYSSLSAKQKLKHVAAKSKALAAMFQQENKSLKQQLSCKRGEFRKHRCLRPEDPISQEWKESDKLNGQEKISTQNSILQRCSFTNIILSLH